MYFLAGVADAEILKGTESFATAKTLIDSSIIIGVSAEDVRAGKGAKLYGKYFHTSTFDLKLSDAMFKMECIAANVGADLELGGDVFKIEELTLKQGKNNIILKETPVSMTQGGKVYIYYKKSTDHSFKVITGDGSNTVNIVIDKEGVYCIKYLYKNESAHKVVINANFTPNTLSIYLTANLYEGDANNISTSTKVGTVTIKVPRFLLSGSQEIAMSMTGAANTPLEGSALATNGEGCNGEGIYAEIIEVIEDRTYNDLTMIKIESDEVGIVIFSKQEEKIRVYGRFLDTGLAILDNSLLKYKVENKSIFTIIDGVITPLKTGSTLLTVSINEDVYDTVLVTIILDDEPSGPDDPAVDLDDGLIYAGISEDGTSIYLMISDLNTLDDSDDIYLSYC